QTVFGLLILLILLSIAYCIERAHQKKKTLWCAYWFGLVMLSSVGLGIGLHTFLIHLGPRIASVTLGAYECGSVDFPDPPYPDQIVCPQQETDAEQVASLFSLMSKVGLEACLWGAGTAIGELPPYFTPRAPLLFGADPDDEDYPRFKEILDQPNFPTRAKVAGQQLIQKVGFFGILACASIPKPLFDLAGITFIKMQNQKLFAIITFCRHILEQMVSFIG
uniref:Uncharacterized protein n=1 Tax=Mola mola TaxID=94237 RepID=A0A3Q3VWL9_MOLML